MGQTRHDQPIQLQKPATGSGHRRGRGPASNILQASVFAGIVRFSLGAMVGENGYLSPLGVFLLSGVTINLALAFFNLIPLKPLDGSWIVTALLPARLAYSYEAWMMRYGPLVFLLLIFVFPSFVGMLIGPPVYFVRGILLRGVPL